MSFPIASGSKPTKEKMSLKTGKLNHQWKGDEVGYGALHDWLKSHFGNADRCENPDCSYANPKRFEWALIKGKNYERKRENFMMMCKSCHTKYDGIGKGNWNTKGLEFKHNKNVIHYDRNGDKNPNWKGGKSFDRKEEKREWHLRNKLKKESNVALAK